MRLLLDQDVYAVTARFLAGLGHHVLTASEIAFSRASDAELLERAQEMGRVLLTRDRDFGALVFLRHLGSGVIYLRFGPANIEKGHEQLRRVLETYSSAELRTSFVVVEPGRHRFRRPPAAGP